MSAKAILQAQNLVKHFGSFEAVKGVSFEIMAGEIFSLLGPNGAGKTTTISMLACLLTPSAGDALIDGASITRQPDAVKQVIGIVPQEIALYGALSARENLTFWGQMYGMSGKTLAARVDEVLERIGLKDRAKDPVHTFSGGMKRRVNIGAGLLHKPKLVFMDEPTVGIDPQSRRSILDMVKELHAQGLTVLYTTHYMEEAQELSQRVGIMDHGKVIAIGSQKQLTQQVGQREIVRLTLADEVLAPEQLACFTVLPEVTDAQWLNGQVVLQVASADAALAAIVGAAQSANLRIAGIEIEEPNLEAVFLHLTGRALRDD